MRAPPAGRVAPDAGGRWLIAGLGNPGPEYAATRHNAGFRVVEELARAEASRWRSERQYLWAELAAQGGGAAAVLVKPLTYMNLSGPAVRAALARWRVPVERLLVVHDDMGLPPGRLRLRRGGSAAGHHGVESVIEALGRSDFARLRVGIGHPAAKEEVVAYVLGAAAGEERAVFEESVTRAGEVVRLLLTRGLEQAMNEANRWRGSGGMRPD